MPAGVARWLTMNEAQGNRNVEKVKAQGLEGW